MTELQPTRLVQGLKIKQEPRDGIGKNAHRVFGGGMIGLSDDGWEATDKLFQLQYMGASEYEWGVFPKAMGFIYEQHKDYCSGVFRLSKTNFPKAYGAKQDDRVPRDVFYICHKEHVGEVKTRIRELAKDKVRVKNGCHLRYALHPQRRSDFDWVGGLELDNNFFFFVHEPTYREVCASFSVKVTEPKKRKKVAK